MKNLHILAACFCTVSSFAQTLYVPNATTTGITNSSNTHVGIGTSTPAFHLEVVESAPGPAGLLLRNSSTNTSAYTTLRLYNNLNVNNHQLEIDYSSSSYANTLVTNGPTGEYASIATTGAFPLVLGTSNTARMTISSSGNVGIGTRSPDYPLTVNGTIHAKEVKVDVSIPTPDYVFEKEYHLPTLAEVKAYINQYKHLPEIPSAKDVEASGMSLGEMNNLLLKKVEELTLYLIEMKEATDSDRVTIAELKNEIAELKKK